MTDERLIYQQCYFVTRGECISDVREKIDIVDAFKRSEDVPSVVYDAIKKKGIKVIWMQSGIHNEEAEMRAKENGIEVVFNRYIKVSITCSLINSSNL
jgi:predicted CoA-binding protein